MQCFLLAAEKEPTPNVKTGLSRDPMKSPDKKIQRKTDEDEAKDGEDGTGNLMFLAQTTRVLFVDIVLLIPITHLSLGIQCFTPDEFQQAGVDLQLALAMAMSASMVEGMTIDSPGQQPEDQESFRSEEAPRPLVVANSGNMDLSNRGTRVPFRSDS